MSKLTDTQKVITLLRSGCTVNDRECAIFHHIFFAHQRIAELRARGWTIDNVYDSRHKLITYKLIAEPQPVTVDSFLQFLEEHSNIPQI